MAQFPEPQSGNDSTNPIGLPWGVKSDNCITHIDHIVSAQWIITGGGGSGFGNDDYIYQVIGKTETSCRNRLR